MKGNQPRGSAPWYPRRAPRLVGSVCFGALRAPLDRCTAGAKRDNEYRIRVWSRTAVQLNAHQLKAGGIRPGTWD
jgi:hypothetical protein